MNAFLKMTSNQLFRGAWLCGVAMVMTGCGGNDRPTADASDRGAASVGSAPSYERHAAMASPQTADGLWRQGAVLNASELQAADEAATQHRSADRSGASSATAKATTNRLAVYRFFNSQTSAHFYTSSATERDSVIASLPQYRYEGLAFWAAASASGGMSPVYRFYNSQKGVHFYTISEQERDHVQANLPQLRYEGVAYYASKTAGADLFPLYRFYLAGKGFHFYTRSASEAAGVRATLPQYLDEGVSYYLPTTAPSGSPTPTLNLAVDVTRVAPDGSTMLTWSSTGATDCSASGGWTGTRGTSGSAGSGLHTGRTVFALVCSGAGGSVARSLATFMGRDKLMIGGGMSDETAIAAPFDARYRYVHSRPAASPSDYTDSLCSSTASSNGWWGCWGGTTTAPGSYVTWWNNHATQATWQGVSRPQMYLWTWYSLRDLGDMAGHGDGPGEVEAINRADLLTLYMNDYRFFLQKIGRSRSMIDLEPDFWGYVKSLGDPHQIPAQVRAANPTDCATQENSAAGLARCLISMARKYAPNTGVGFHSSCFDYQSDPQGCYRFMKDISTGADFLVADVADRDAAWYAIKEDKHWFWWDGQKGADALAFYKALTTAVGKPLVLWQIPVGNMSLDNTLNRYQDDKVDYFFSHMNQVVDANIVGLLFGAGHHETTSPDTDGGNLINKTTTLWNAGGIRIR
jgi:hypothetical protein